MVSPRVPGLILLAATALTLRVVLVLAVATEHRAPLTYEHGEIAQNLLAGRGFTVRFLGTEGPTSQQAPLYPLLLAVAYQVFGIGSSHAILAMQIVQCFAGVALVLSVAWLTWLLVPVRPWAGWLAGWGAALYPPHIYMATHIQVVSWSSLLLVLTTALVLSPHLNGTWRKPMLAGVLGGLLVLFDPILALGLPILATAMFVRHYALGSARSVIVFPLVTLAVIFPWLARNYRVHGEVVFIKSTFGYAFWQGNNAASWGTDKIPKVSAEALRSGHDGSLADIDRALWEARHETYYIDDLLLKPTGYREFVGLSEPQRSRLLSARAWEFIRKNPGRYAQLCLARLRYFLLWDETNPKAANPIYRASSLAWLVASAVGLCFCLCERAAWRSLWPLVAVCAGLTLFHVLTIVSARFRIPMEPLTFVWCGWGLSRLPVRGWSAISPRRVYSRLSMTANG